MNYLEGSLNEYNQKDADNNLKLAIEYIYEKNEEKDLKYFIILCKKAALQGNEEAQFILGILYQSGIEGLNGYFGINISEDEKYGKINLEKSLYWFDMAAKKGSSKAQYTLGYIYEQGIGVEIDYKRAVEFYKKSALQGDPIGQCNLGYMYEKGLGIEIDLKKAVLWYEKSASQGDEVGQNNLGEAYRDGIGVETDYGKAMKLFLKSAEQGCSEAEYNIGIIYENGLGVEVDYKQAAIWYEKAYNNGLDKAKDRLRKLDYL